MHPLVKQKLPINKKIRNARNSHEAVELKKAKDDLKEMREELSESKDDLNAANEQLQTTQEQLSTTKTKLTESERKYIKLKDELTQEEQLNLKLAHENMILLKQLKYTEQELNRLNSQNNLNMRLLEQEKLARVKLAQELALANAKVTNIIVKKRLCGL